ncbi:MAG: type I methionyl aminopeptidase [Spirochaetia bacterium]|jgi:methionyl aminopeptidase|nr:type I methionyl aminopeptidase [Spirochaetia bacterium]
MENDDVKLKTSLEVARISISCKIIESIFIDLGKIIIQGISTGEIEDFCIKSMNKKQAHSSAFGYNGFPSTICTSVNTVAVHGLPGNYKLKDGDIITVDIILNVDGWHGDGAYTYLIGNVSNDLQRLYKAAKEATNAGIKAARAGQRIGDIGFAISASAARWGCSVIEELAGHGIGLDVHEDPVILSIGELNVGLPIVPGMVFTIEPVLTLGSGQITTLDDTWSIVTSDGQYTAQFEHTIAIFGKRTEVLTSPNLSYNFVI